MKKSVEFPAQQGKTIVCSQCHHQFKSRQTEETPDNWYPLQIIFKVMTEHFLKKLSSLHNPINNRQKETAYFSVALTTTGCLGL